MKAQVLTKTAPVERSHLELADLPVPEPTGDQVRLRVQACGICHTDLHTVEGDISLPRLPVVPGHQIVGMVDVLGKALPGSRRVTRWASPGSTPPVALAATA